MKNAKPTYLLGMLTVKNMPEYMDRYGAPVLPYIEKYHGEILSVSLEQTVLEGEWSSNYAVLLKFPSKDDALGFYHSEEYRPLMELRVNTLTDSGTVMLLDGFDPADFGQ